MIVKSIKKRKIYFNNNKILKRYNKNLNYLFDWMRKLKLKKPIILDIGANIGMYSLCYSEIYPNSNIHSFEPVQKNFNTLKSNLKKNKNKLVKIYNFGLLDKKKKIKIGIPDKSIHKRYEKNINDGLFSIFAKNRVNFIKVVSLDEFVKKKKIKSIDFIKIDVEGAEGLVLEGAKKTIKIFRPIIQLEFNKLTEVLGKKKITFFQKFARKFNYKILYLAKNYKLKKQLNSKKSFYSDLVFLRK